jgi:hypothetical protein
MRSLMLFLLFSTFNLYTYSQDSLTCNFETLFTLKPGIDKADAVQLITKNNLATLTNTQMGKIPPYKGTSGDSIVREILIYRPNGTRCFKGSNTMIQMEFADNKLYKAYISTEYPKSAYHQMLENYSFLRSVIKAKWPHESSLKVTADNTVGFGYNYSKTKKPTNQAELISLQYLDFNVNSLTNNYLLEVIWANLKDTRMQNSNF